jgi:hypothetical protein
MKKILILALFLAAAARPAAGQSYRTFEEEYSGLKAATGWRLGPLKALPVLRLFNVGYDSNVFYRPKEETAISDYIATVSPEIKAAWLLGTSAILSFTENPEYNFYLRETGLRAFNNSWSPAIRLLLVRRLSLSGDYHFLRHLRRATSEFETPLKDTQKGWTARVFFETPRGTALGFSGAVEDLRFSNPGLPDPALDYARTLDRREKSAAFEFYYRVFSESRVFIKAGATDYEFQDPLSAWRNARSAEIVGGLRFPLLGWARGRVALGYKSFLPKAAGRKEFSGLVADTDAAFRAGRAVFSLAYKRDNVFSYIDAAYFFIEDRFRCGLSYDLLPFLRLEGSAQLGAWRYPEPHQVWFGGEPVLVQDRRDLNRVFSAGFAVRVAGNTGLAVSYNFYRRTSNAPGFDIDRNFAGAALSYDF